MCHKNVLLDPFPLFCKIFNRKWKRYFFFLVVVLLFSFEDATPFEFWREMFAAEWRMEEVSNGGIGACGSKSISTHWVDKCSKAWVCLTSKRQSIDVVESQDWIGTVLGLSVCFSIVFLVPWSLAIPLSKLGCKIVLEFVFMCWIVMSICPLHVKWVFFLNFVTGHLSSLNSSSSDCLEYEGDSFVTLWSDFLWF